MGLLCLLADHAIAFAQTRKLSENKLARSGDWSHEGDWSREHDWSFEGDWSQEGDWCLDSVASFTEP